METTMIPAKASDPANACDAVLELPGLYGPFTFPEKLLQKIWLRREFDGTRSFTTEGCKITVVHPGKWNLMGGPDFKNARLRFGDGPEVSGDIELHLYAADWLAHRHARDPAYDRVILHVVLFPPSPGHITRGVRDVHIPVLVVLPLLYHDLEEYAAEDAVEILANRPASQIVELLGPLSSNELTALLNRMADARWSQKVRFAELRINRLGWDEACHQTALEILGYRFNRVAMLRVAASMPLGAWTKDVPDLEAAFASGGEWSLQGLRPANHPRVRLRQYARWSRARPDWPTRLTELGRLVSKRLNGEGTAEVRRVNHFSGLRRTWNEEVTDAVIGGTRFDNLMCDGFFPLLAAFGKCAPRELWFHWFTGDVPPLWRDALKQLEVFSARERPACHGFAQGMLGWLIERERSALVSAGRSA